jgi:hypothetical protein
MHRKHSILCVCLRETPLGFGIGGTAVWWEARELLVHCGGALISILQHYVTNYKYALGWIVRPNIFGRL